MKKPACEKATVVIPTYNRSKLLDRTLHSLTLSATPRSNFQVLVCDDGSSDNTKDVVNRYKDALDIVHNFQEDRGYQAAKARNMALEHAKYPLLIFLDDGVIVSKEFINAHLAIHRQSNRPVLAIGYVFGFGPLWGWTFEEGQTPEKNWCDLIDYDAVDETISRLKTRGILDIREDLYQRVEDDISQCEAPWAIAFTANVSVERDVMRIVGGFSEFEAWGDEDIDFAYRLSRCGIEITLARDAAGIHIPHPHEKPKDSEFFENLRKEMKRYDDPMLAAVINQGVFVPNGWDGPYQPI